MKLEVKLLQVVLYESKCVWALAQVFTHLQEVSSVSQGDISTKRMNLPFS